MGKNRQIGKDNKLLWRISDDLKNFKKITLGHHMLMGRKTFESIGKALPGRTTIIMTKNPDYTAEGCIVVNSFDQAVKIAEAAGDDEFFICGGGEIYKDLLDRSERFYLSFVDYDGEADTYFPDLSNTRFSIVEEVKYEKNEKSPAWIYRVFDRK